MRMTKLSFVLFTAILVGIATGMISNKFTHAQNVENKDAGAEVEPAPAPPAPEVKIPSCVNVMPGTLFHCPHGESDCKRYNKEFCGANFTSCEKIGNAKLCISSTVQPALN